MAVTRAAVITGAARGIGAATARHLAAQGWRVALLDACAENPALSYPLASRADLDAAVAACGEAAVGLVADVRDAAAVAEGVAEASQRFGGLDAAVAAAGVIAGGAPAWATSAEVWRTMLDVNLTGVWHLARAAVPLLLEQPEPRSGRFVAVASAAGLRGLPRLSAYAAAKHGVIGLVRSLAADLGDSGVTANAVCPGSTTTAMLDASVAVYGLDGPEAFAAHAPQARLLDAAEVATVIGWLCSAAAGGITGAAVPVDGGMTAT